MNRGDCLVKWMPTHCESEPRPVSKTRLIVTRIGDSVYRFGRFVSRLPFRARNFSRRVHWSTVADSVFFPAFVLAVFTLLWIAEAMGIG